MLKSFHLFFVEEISNPHLCSTSTEKYHVFIFSIVHFLQDQYYSGVIIVRYHYHHQLNIRDKYDTIRVPVVVIHYHRNFHIYRHLPHDVRLLAHPFNVQYQK